MPNHLELVLCRRFATKVKTVEPQQLKAFTDMANEWWSKTGKCGPLHALNKCRIPWIQNRLVESGVIQPHVTSSAPLAGLSVLDVGCGGGILSEGLSRLGCKVTGLDASKDLIAIAKLHAETQNLPNLRYVVSTIQEHANENKENYDVVVSSEVIEHVTEQEEFVKYCVQCVKPGGSIFMTTPNKTWLSWFHMIFLFENVFRILPKKTHRYDMFIHLDELKEVLKKGGILSEGLSRLGCKLTGLDASHDLNAIAKLHAETQNLPNLRYVISTIQEHATENKEKYDVVVNSEVIEHVSEQEEFVKYCVQCVKPGGSIFMTTPNKTWILPKGTHRYDMFIHADELKNMLRKENCETVHTYEMFYLFLRNKWYMTKNESVTYLLHAVKRL